MELAGSKMATFKGVLTSAWSFIRDDLVGLRRECPRCHHRMSPSLPRCP
jgi:hypothetical protein